MTNTLACVDHPRIAPVPQRAEQGPSAAQFFRILLAVVRVDLQPNRPLKRNLCCFVPCSVVGLEQSVRERSDQAFLQRRCPLGLVRRASAGTARSRGPLRGRSGLHRRKRTVGHATSRAALTSTASSSCEAVQLPLILRRGGTGLVRCATKVSKARLP